MSCSQGMFCLSMDPSLPRVAEEMLYSAMEDFYVDIMVGQGTTAHPFHFPLPPFTLVGATTRAGCSRRHYGIASESFLICNIMKTMI